VRTEAANVIRLVKIRADKHVELTEKLCALWADPAQRVKDISSVDPSLMNATQQRLTVENEDLQSEYGGGASVYSNMSLASNASALSAMSNTSVQSTLSSLSLTSSSGGVGRSGSELGSTRVKSFAIDGIEHNLLSRGKVDKTDFSQYDSNAMKAKKKKQKMRAKDDGGGRDVYGVKQEGVLARNLYGLGDVSAVVRMASEICDTLLLVGGWTAQGLACEVRAFENFILSFSLLLISLIMIPTPTLIVPVYTVYISVYLYVKRYKSPLMRTSSVYHPLSPLQPLHILLSGS
jgi:hypothetical protein